MGGGAEAAGRYMCDVTPPVFSADNEAKHPSVTPDPTQIRSKSSDAEKMLANANLLRYLQYPQRGTWYTWICKRLWNQKTVMESIDELNYCSSPQNSTPTHNIFHGNYLIYRSQWQSGFQQPFISVRLRTQHVPMTHLEFSCNWQLINWGHYFIIDQTSSHLIS